MRELKYCNIVFTKEIKYPERKWRVETRLFPSGKKISMVWVGNGFSWHSPTEEQAIPKDVIKELEKTKKQCETYCKKNKKEIQNEIDFHQEPKILITTRNLPHGMKPNDEFEQKAQELVALYKAAPQLLKALEKIANGEGIYGMQAGEYKKIAREAIKKVKPES